MKRYIFISVAFVAILLMGLGKDDHKHIWLAPVPDTVRVDLPRMALGVYRPLPSGWQKGAELVCIKCYQRKTQMVDYGPPEYIDLPSMLPDTIIKWQEATKKRILGEY